MKKNRFKKNFNSKPTKLKELEKYLILLHWDQCSCGKDKQLFWFQVRTFLHNKIIFKLLIKQCVLNQHLKHTSYWSIVVFAFHNFTVTKSFLFTWGCLAEIWVRDMEMTVGILEQMLEGIHVQTTFTKICFQNRLLTR